MQSMQIMQNLLCILYVGCHALSPLTLTWSQWTYTSDS